MTDTLVVIEARMGSTRLPGKVALPVAGAPLLVRMIERVRAATPAFDVCVATSTLPGDDAVVELARQADVRWFRGDPLDCLSRHLGAANEAGARWVVKIPSDCPLIDPAAIDAVLGAFFEDPEAYDFVSNLHPPTWPDGNDVEIMPRALLERACREATRELDREHTTPFFWDPPGRFRIGNVALPSGQDLHRSHRFTIDYPEDYQFVCAVFDALYHRGAPPFGLRAILDSLAERPEIAALNDKYAGVNWYRHHVDELSAIDASMTRTDVP